MDEDSWGSNRFPILVGALLGGLAGAAWGTLVWNVYWWIGMILAAAVGAFCGFERESIIEAGCAVVIACGFVIAVGPHVVQLPGRLGILARIFFGFWGSVAMGIGFGRLGGAVSRLRRR